MPVKADRIFSCGRLQSNEENGREDSSSSSWASGNSRDDISDGVDNFLPDTDQGYCNESAVAGDSYGDRADASSRSGTGGSDLSDRALEGEGALLEVRYECVFLPTDYSYYLNLYFGTLTWGVICSGRRNVHVLGSSAL
jgi:hypothetical protein